MFSKGLNFFFWPMIWIERTLSEKILIRRLTFFEMFEVSLTRYIVVRIIGTYEYILSLDNL